MLKRGSFEHWSVVASAVCVLGAVSSVRAADSGPFAAVDLGWAECPQYYYTVVSSEAGFNGYVGVEASFVALGSIAGPLTHSAGVTLADPRLQFSVKGKTLAAVGMLPLGGWDLFLKGGVFFADAELQVGGRDTSSQTQHGLVGLGADRHFGENWSTRVGFTDYLSVGSSSQIRGPDIRMLSEGVAYAF
jgi:hypothetical protein